MPKPSTVKPRHRDTCEHIPKEFRVLARKTYRDTLAHSPRCLSVYAIVEAARRASAALPPISALCDSFCVLLSDRKILRPGSFSESPFWQHAIIFVVRVGYLSIRTFVI